MPRMTGNRYIAKMLEAYGITSIFQVPTAFFGVMAEMENMDIRRVVTHGEKAAAYMADGYARASRGPGICMAQSIGAANLAAGLADAFMGQSPVIAMTNAIPAEHRYRHVYQEYDHAAPFHSVTKASYEVDKVSRVPDSLRQTFREATTGSPGPVHLHVRDEALYAEADLDLVVEERHARYPAFRPEPSMDHVKEAARLISQARRPVIISGSGVMASGAWPEVAQLAEMLTIPVATTLNGKMTLCRRPSSQRGRGGAVLPLERQPNSVVGGLGHRHRHTPGRNGHLGMAGPASGRRHCADRHRAHGIGSKLPRHGRRSGRRQGLPAASY